jgi:1-acyl-sn-glycerol-3-phosphate acyltransferase
MPGHVSVVRGDKDSGHAMMAACADYLRRGVSILFFAEGTRLLGGTEPVGPFKPGAFKLALDTGAAILPVSVSGARDLLPARGFPRMGYGEPVLTIHPPIDPPPREAVARMSPEEAKAAVGALAERTRGIIMQDMRPCDAVVLSAKEKAKVAAAEAAKEAAAAAAPAGPASKKVS